MAQPPLQPVFRVQTSRAAMTRALNALMDLDAFGLEPDDVTILDERGGLTVLVADVKPKQAWALAAFLAGHFGTKRAEFEVL